MSSAFVKEGEEQWLHDVSPTRTALLHYLTKENNGISVYEKKFRVDGNGREVIEMSNGLAYAIDKDGRWEIVW